MYCPMCRLFYEEGATLLADGKYQESDKRLLNALPLNGINMRTPRPYEFQKKVKIL